MKHPIRCPILICFFLENLSHELSRVCEDGVPINDNNKVSIKVNAFVCDAPARADLKRIVSHSSYYSCERCIQKGSYAGGHVALMQTDATLRTDDGFRLKSDFGHHKPGPTSVIENLGIGLVSCFSLDYMHLVCIGITKRLLNREKSSKKFETKCHISVEARVTLEASIKNFSTHVPSDFSRKLSGGLNALVYWKATELRLFLLYAGIIVLRNILPSEQYNNFLFLSIAFRILLSNSQTNNVENARKLLINFVNSASLIYGDGFISYNVHSVIHIPDDYLRWGPLDNVSCFAFETYLGSIIKGRLSGRNKPLEQIARHVTKENSKIIAEDPSKPNLSSKKFSIGSTIFKCGPVPGRDNCVMLDSGKIGIIRSISIDSLSFVLFRNKDPLFEYPVDSQKVGIFKVSELKVDITGLVEMVHSKVMLIPENDHFVAIQFLHRLKSN